MVLVNAPHGLLEGDEAGDATSASAGTFCPGDLSLIDFWPFKPVHCVLTVFLLLLDLGFPIGDTGLVRYVALNGDWSEVLFGVILDFFTCFSLDDGEGEWNR